MEPNNKNSNSDKSNNIDNTQKQTTGMKRNTIDKFYTNQVVVNKYIDKFKQCIHDDNDLIIEPSAGNGVWTAPLNMFNLIAFDIQPEGDGIQQVNFLDVDLYAFQKQLHFIGNPPFGRQSSMARKFIKHICGCQNTQTVAFILPKSFKKISSQSVFPLNYHLQYQDDVVSNAFLVNGKPYNVPCVFQIWVKKNILREKPEKLKPQHFKFVKKEEHHDIAFRRVGVYAGKIYKDSVDKSEQSHYFIKFNETVLLSQDMYRRLNAIEFADCCNTVGPKSISKQELIKVYNFILKKYV